MLRVPAKCDGAYFIRGRLDRGQVGIQRRLHVHDDVAALRQVYHHVRPQGAILSDHVNLFFEVAVRRHACELHEAPKRDLAPLAPHLRLAERLDEISRLALKRGLCFAHIGEVLAKAAEVALSFRLDFTKGIRRAGERLLDRLDERLNGLLALFQRRLGDLLVAAQVFTRKAQEVLDVLAQLPAGEVVKAPIELFHGSIERHGAFRLEGGRAAPSHPPAGGERDGDRQQDDDQGSSG